MEKKDFTWQVQQGVHGVCTTLSLSFNCSRLITLFIPHFFDNYKQYFLKIVTFGKIISKATGKMTFVCTNNQKPQKEKITLCKKGLLQGGLEQKISQTFLQKNIVKIFQHNYYIILFKGNFHGSNPSKHYNNRVFRLLGLFLKHLR